MDDQTRQKNTVNPTAEILHSHQCQIKHLNIVFVYERKSQMATLYAPVIMPVGNRCKEATGRRPAAHRTQLLALKLLNSCSNWEDIWFMSVECSLAGKFQGNLNLFNLTFAMMQHEIILCINLKIFEITTRLLILIGQLRQSAGYL